MKNVITLCLLLASVHTICAQTWFELDQTWIYGYFQPWATVGYEEMTIKSDTVVNGINAFQLTTKRVSVDQTLGDNATIDTNNIFTPIVYEENEIVYYYVNSLGDFHPLFNFNLAVGDTMRYLPPNAGVCQDPYYTIAEVGTMDVGGQTLKFQIILLAKELVMYEDSVKLRIVERIGPTGSFYWNATAEDWSPEGGGVHFFFYYNIDCTTDPSGHSLRCYSDSDIIDYNPGGGDCTLPILISVNDPILYRNNVFPNPFNNSLTFTHSEGSKEVNITIVDVRGRKKFEGSVFTNQEIDYSYLDAGMYFISVEIDGKQNWHKVVKIE